MREKVMREIEPVHESKAKLLDAALSVIRAKGYHATRIEDICAAADLTKGSFFHHFKGKEALALAAADHWAETTAALFAEAPYHTLEDPLARLLSYLDFRESLLEGELASYTCLVGTMVQETYDTSPAIRVACERCISAHANTLEADIEAAVEHYGISAPGWDAASLALHTQVVLQGAFVLAKARHGAEVARDSIGHLKRYICLLFDPKRATETREPF